MRIAAVEISDIRRCDSADTLIAKERIDEQLNRSSIFRLRRLLAPHLHMFPEEPLSQLPDSHRLAQLVTSIGGIGAAASDGPEHLLRVTPRARDHDRTELADHDPARAPLPAILDQKEALAARHHADAEAGQIGVEPDVVLLVDGEGLDASFG